MVTLKFSENSIRDSFVNYGMASWRYLHNANERINYDVITRELKYMLLYTIFWELALRP